MAVQGVVRFSIDVLLEQGCVKAMAQYSRTKSEAWRRRRFRRSTSRAVGTRVEAARPEIPREIGKEQDAVSSRSKPSVSRSTPVFLRYLMHGVGNFSNFSIAGGEDPGLGSTCWHTVVSQSVSGFSGKTGRQEHLMNERGQQSR